jgi:hypothetical protein
MTAVKKKGLCKSFEAKIDADLFREMVNARKPDTEIAGFFGVTPQAVWNRKKRMAAKGTLDPVRSLTECQAKFVGLLEQGVKPIAAITAVKNVLPGCEKVAVARMMASPGVKEAVSAILVTAGVTRELLASKLKTHVDSAKPEISLRAVDMGFKLHDDYPAAKNVNLNIDVAWFPIDLNEFKPRPVAIEEKSVDAEYTSE